jgi:hypothetical protein
VLPTDTLAFLSPALPVNLTAGQVVLVSAQIMLGTTSSSGAGGLKLWICYQPNGGSITTAHPVDWVSPMAAGNSLNAYPLTDTITGLGTGQYSVGLCGSVTSVPTTWDRQDWAYTTAEVISGAAILTGGSSSSTSRQAP